MKKLLTSIAALAIGLFASSTAFADGPPGGSIKDTPVGATCGTSAHNWAGRYAGIIGGAAHYRSAVTLEDFLGIASQREESGLTIGGVIGYNWQRCNTVFGIDADLSWTNVDRSWGLNVGGLGLPIGNVFTANSKIDLYSSIKMRTGFAFDNLLLYLTGGIAFANIEHTGGNVAFPGVPANTIGFRESDTRWGWVVGAGTEYAFTDRITLRSEATYTRFEDKDFNLSAGALAPITIRLNAQDELWLVRSGLNFKF